MASVNAYVDANAAPISVRLSDPFVPFLGGRLIVNALRERRESVRRLLVAAIVVGLVGSAGSADATTNTATCRVPPAESGTAPATDIICFGVNIDCANAVGALRVRSTDTAAYPTTMLGARWSVSFLIDGVRHEFVLTRSIAGQDSATMHVAGGSDQTPAVLVSSTTITWSVPRNATAALRQGGVITEVSGRATDALGQGWEKTHMDSPDEPVRTPSCR